MLEAQAPFMLVRLRVQMSTFIPRMTLGLKTRLSFGLSPK